MFRQTAAIMLFAIPLPAAAQTDTAAMTGAPMAAKPKSEKKICRRVQETGSIMGGRSICHSKSEWSAIDTANNDAAATSRETHGAAGGTRGL